MGIRLKDSPYFYNARVLQKHHIDVSHTKASVVNHMKRNRVKGEKSRFLQPQLYANRMLALPKVPSLIPTTETAIQEALNANERRSQR
jgi:hypothetical protein